ncbi:MAG: MCE family protein [Aeromicrobium erythreum]
MAGLSQRFAGLSRVVTVFVVLALVGALVVMFGQRDGTKYLVVDFPQTNSLYRGSDVKILGVAVGRVEEITPRGESVRVKLSYRGDVKLPRDVKAVIVSPSIVGDRFVQLTPAYDGGAVLADNASLPESRTAVPVELDQIYQSLDDLSVALGPKGANKNGALASLIKDSANQLDGQGAQLNETLRNFGKLSTTLSNNKEELFGSVREVNDFVKLLQRNDTQVRSFFDSTAKVSTVLADERENLQKTLEALGKALIDVRGLVRDNRGELRANISNLQELARILAKRNKEIGDFTVDAPTALSNVALTYNGSSGTLDNRADILELLTGALKNLPTTACTAIANQLPEGTLTEDQCKSILGGLDGILGGVLPRAAAASGPQVLPERTHESVADMLAVK